MSGWYLAPGRPRPKPWRDCASSADLRVPGQPTIPKEPRMRTVTKRVLVTGGAGFLGSHLCERLGAPSHDVLFVDKYFTGRKDNIADLLSAPLLEAMRHEVTHPFFVEVDEIYTLACPASPIHYQFDPVQTT